MGSQLSQTLIELAEAYETLAVRQERLRSVKLRRVSTDSNMMLPPGAWQILDDDERMRLRNDISAYAANVSFLLFSNRIIEQILPTVTERLREASKHADALTTDDEIPARDLLRRSLRIITSKRLVSTGKECLAPICEGIYLADVSGGVSDLVCDQCTGRVPFDRWRAWPKQSSDAYISVGHAATLLGTTITAVRQRARRSGWRRRRYGREVRYHWSDITDANQS